MFVSKTRRPVRSQVALVESMDSRRHCDADNSLGSAADLGTVSAYTVKAGNLTSGSDTKDFYKFVIPAGSKNVGVKLGSLGKNADLYLYNSSKSQIASSKNGGTSSEVLTKALSPGTYYAEVRAKDNNSATTSYSLKLMSDAAGNEKAKARDTNVLYAGTNKTFSDYVGSLDFNDYYKFETTSNTNVKVTLSGLSADADIVLLKSDGTAFAASSYSGTASEEIVRDLAPGTYYVQVKPFTASIDTKYTLNLAATAGVTDTGNTRATAKAVTSPFTGSETIGAGDTFDFYKINVPSTSYAIMKLTTTDNPVTLAYYGEDGSYIGSDTATVGNPAELSYFLHAGGVRYVAALNSSGTLAHYSISIKTQAF